MRLLISIASAGVVLTAALVAAAPAAMAGSGGCTPTPVLVNGVVQVICVYSSGSGGGPGSGGSGGGQGKDACTLEPSVPSQAADFPYPAPKGDKWMWEICTESFNGAPVPGTAGWVLVGKGATNANPGVTPEQLLAQAIKDLQVPTLTPATAPPRGRDGLVGLPEWFWIPRSEWHPAGIHVSLGPVWATVIATPGQVTFSPGAGLPSVACAGPGTAYSRNLAASAQSTNCSYIYDQPSVHQPGSAYQASVTVTWDITWQGSGGAGGTIDAGLQVPFPFAVPVAQGEALVTTP